MQREVPGQSVKLNQEEMSVGSSLRVNTPGPSAALGILLGFLHPRALPDILRHLAEEEDVALTPAPVKHRRCMATRILQVFNSSAAGCREVLC